MADRYFSETPIQGESARLVGPEAHHLLHVMRAGAGTRVVLFDGSGAEFEAEVLRTGRSEVELAVLTRAEIDRELPIDVTLGVALPKGERQRWLVEKAVELGVRRLVPLRTARSVAEPAPKALDRLRRTVIEASKQCGRNRLMEIAEPKDWAEWVAATEPEAVRLVAHPGGTAVADVLTTEPAGRIVAAVGPEGGLTDEEIAQAVKAGWRLVGLGPRILRIETAALKLVAIVAERSGEGGRG